MTTIEILRDIKTKLTGINGINTVQIGLEKATHPQDYPIIRIVPSKTGQNDYMDFGIYFGDNLNANGGMEAIYEAHSAWEQAIKEALHFQEVEPSLVIEFVDTILDEDRFENFKISCSRYKVSR